MTEPANQDRRVHPALPLIVGLLVGAAGGFVVAKQLTPAPKAGAVNTVYVSTTVTAPAPGPATTPASAPGVHKLGQTVPVTGATVTAYAYRQPVATGSPKPDEAGHIWAAMDVKVCVTGLSTISNERWSLVYANAGQVTASGTEYGGFPTPDYPFEKTIQPGRCVRGWITCSVSPNAKPTMIEYSLDSGETVDWKI